jgi:hypothetical protein
MKRGRNPYQPGTEAYAKFRAAELRRRESLARGREARAKSPETRRRAQQQASAARSAINRIVERREYRASLNEHDRREFNRLSITQQDQVRRAVQQYPGGIPPDVPDPFTGPRRSSTWRSYYSTRAGIRLRASA